MNKCCKKCDYEFSIWGEPVARGCNDSNCECHKKMTNQPWQEKVLKAMKGEVPRDTEFDILEAVSELLQEERAKIKEDILSGKDRGSYDSITPMDSFTAGYKAGREDCVNRIKTIWNDSHYMIPQDVLLEELQNLINKDEI